MFKVGDVITIRWDADEEELDGRTRMRGATVTIIDIYNGDYLDIHTDYEGGWWINSSAIDDGIPTKTKVEKKIAFMYKRFEERDNV